MEYVGGLPRAEAERLARKIALGVADEAEQMQLLDETEYRKARDHFNRMFGK